MSTSEPAVIHTSRADDLLRLAGGAGLAIVAAALPWELFQRMPGTSVTLIELGAAFAIAAAAISWVRTKGQSFPRTGLVPCIGLFAFVAVLSVIRSHDVDATQRLLRAYAGYLLFFFAMATFNRSPQAAARLLTLYAISAVAVALLTLFAAAGWIWPVHWDTAFWPQQRLLHEFRDGLPMRMAGTSIDFNQASLLLLVALGAVLFLPAATRRGRIVQVVFGSILFAAIAIGMSRSGVLIGTGLIFAAVMRSARGRRRIVVVGVLLAGSTVALFVFGDFASMFTMRAQGGVVYNEGSAENRVEVYGIALQMVPQYALLGAGLGASEAAMRESAHEAGAVMAVHSMPLLLLLELGLLGLIAYLWLWFRVFRDGVRFLMRSADDQTKRLGAAYGGVTAVTFAMLLVQPFMVLPLYPFLLALGFGPVARLRRADQETPMETERPAVSYGLAVAATLIVFAVASENVIQFQRTAARTESYADLLESGLTSEDGGEWDRAASRFAQASGLARGGLRRKPFFNEAFALIDLKPLYSRFGVADDSTPEAVGLFAAGRALLADGRLDDADAVLRTAWSIDPQFAYIQFHLAEAYWDRARFSEAVTQYAGFAALEAVGDGPVARIREASASSIYGPDSSGLSAQLSRLHTARRSGHWDEAVAAANDALSINPACAEAHFILGVDAELGGRDSRVHYRAALATLPNHHLAHVALNDDVSLGQDSV